MSTELKAEDKQRIEEEEQKREAEEQYRAKIRADLAESHLSGPKRNWTRILLVVLCLIVATATAWLIWDRKVEADRVEAARIASIPQIHYVPVSEPLATDQLTLKAGDVHLVHFTVSADMRETHIVGRFTAGGTNGADIEALLMTEDEFPNWDHGHPPKMLYSTNGPKTTDRFDVALDPGAYVLIFNNRAAILFTRYVTPQVELKYSRAEKE